MSTQLRAFSSGGGIQSVAALILSAKRVIDFPLHIFANTYKKRKEWVNMFYDEPVNFWMAVKLEAKLNAKRNGLQKDQIYLSGFGILLSELAEILSSNRQLSLFGSESEECSGYCWT